MCFWLEVGLVFFDFFFFKQKTAYEISACLVGSEMCIRDRTRDKPHGCNAGRIIYEIVEQYDKVLAEMQAFFMQITFKRNASSATAERLFHF